jgi:hypothetical protein
VSAVDIPPKLPTGLKKIILIIPAPIRRSALIETHTIAIPTAVGCALHTASAGPGKRLIDDSRRDGDRIGKQYQENPKYYFLHFFLHGAKGHQGARNCALGGSEI